MYWTDDISILFTNYTDFIPSVNQSRTEQLNSITRLCFYILIGILLIGLDEKYLYLPITGIFVCYIMYKLDSFSPLHNTIVPKEDSTNDLNINNNFIESDLDVNNYDDNDNDDSTEFSMSLVNNNTSNEPKICKTPSKDNPYMNSLVSEYNSEHPIACNSDDAEINDKIKELYNEDIFRNLEDLWDIKNSQRQFYTVNDIGDQPKFANYLYKTDKTCKEDQKGCLKYEDLRFKR